jgi:hypothetical protein
MSKNKFEIYQDNLGKWWIWCPLTETNLAIRKNTKEDALLKALDFAIYYIEMNREKRLEAEKIVEKLRSFTAEVFGEEE